MLMIKMKRRSKQTNKQTKNQQKKKTHNNTCTQSDMGEVISNFFSNRGGKSIIT